jgi:L-threonylcarbamoyladenylate synthase
VKTRVLPVDTAEPDVASLREAAAVIRAGGLVAFPTETVYGLGANALDGTALGRIYAAKRRPASDPIIAHIGAVRELARLAVDIPAGARELAGLFWPGPLTLVLRRAPGVPDAIASGRATVAVRMPAHPVARALLQASGLPIGAPSANTFTRPSATTAAHVLEDLDGRIELVLDGGPTPIGVESTVLDLTGKQPTVLRPGGVFIEDLREVLPELQLATRYVNAETATSSPGQMLKHYSPRAEVLLFRDSDSAPLSARMRACALAQSRRGRRVGFLLTEEDAPALAGLGDVETLGSRDDLTQASQRLFAALRDLDARGVDVILVGDPGRAGIGAALWDRLLRAAEGRVVAEGR